MSGLAQIGILVALFIGVISARSQLSVTASAGSLVGEVLSIVQGATVTLTFETPTLTEGWKVEVAGAGAPRVAVVAHSTKLVTLTITNVQPVHNVPDGFGYGFSPIVHTGSNPQSVKVGEIRLRVILPKRFEMPVTLRNGTLLLPIKAADGVTPLAISDGQFMEVWSTTNLLSTNWVVVPGSLSADDGILYLNDTAASSNTWRLYRIIDR